MNDFTKRKVVFFYMMILTIIGVVMTPSILDAVISGMVFLSPLILSWLIAHRVVTTYPVVSGIAVIGLIIFCIQMFLQLPNAKHPLINAALLGLFLGVPISFMYSSIVADIKNRKSLTESE
ncbi:hypothetical protein [Vibrio rumoiensis]|uniref:hypothetical protein n=1 Tax=Vibrio rumoiensis TaxID=76258 RepID=UPI003AA954CD